MNRRHFLAGLGASAFVAPWIGRALATTGAPCRFVFVVEGNAVEPVSLMSTATRAAIDAQATASTTGRRWMPRQYGHSSPLVVQTGNLGTAHALSPLQTGGADLTGRSAVVLGLSSLIAGGGHTSHHGALGSTRSRPTKPGGPTIDAFLAAQAGVRQGSPFDAFRCGVDGVSVNVGQTSVPRKLQTETCAVAAGQPAPVILEPSLAFESLFSFLPGTTGNAAFGRRSDQLVFGREDVAHALTQFGGNSDERRKLEQYLESLDVMIQRQAQLDTMAASFDPALPPDITGPGFTGADHLTRLQAQFDNVAAALIGGLTNVAVVTSGTGGGFDRMTYPAITSAYGNVPPLISRHDLHHGSAGNLDYQSVIHDVTRAHVALIARLARTLDAVAEDGGTMLDNTVIVFLSDNGEQHHSTAEEWPVLLVGGSNLGMQTDGRTVVYPGVNHSNNRQMSNLWNTLGHAAGVPLNDFGAEGSTRIAEGPLSELRA